MIFSLGMTSPPFLSSCCELQLLTVLVLILFTRHNSVRSHAQDLAGSKEIVLARGEVNSKVLLPTDKCGAKWLVCRPPPPRPVLALPPPHKLFCSTAAASSARRSAETTYPSAAQASTTHRFYGDERLARHPRMFNQRPDEFNFKALLQECGIGQGAPGAA